MRLLFFYIILFILNLKSFSQGSFPPEVGAIGSTAIHKDSSIFTGWATTCVLNRGPQNILDNSLGLATSGIADNATGHSGQKGTVSLGDGGSATLSFEHPIINGLGPDFAVFENAFNDYFLELAFVEVSTDGINYVRFPSYSETSTDNQIGGFEELNPTNIHNLAGKYKVNYGTPFDLEDLLDSNMIDINNINHVRIIDVIGIINDTNTSYDEDSNMINDPFPTPYPTSGFDLDAIGVIHQTVTINEQSNLKYSIYPNPSEGEFYINTFETTNSKVEIFDQFGKTVYSSLEYSNDIHLNLNLSKGIYILSISDGFKIKNQKIIIK